MQPLDDLSEQLSKVWSPVSHLHSVMQSDALRDTYNACLPLITEYSTMVMQNQDLYKAVESIFSDNSFQQFDYAQKKGIENLIHASANSDEAKMEIALWFKKEELHSYSTVHEKHVF